MTREPKCRGCGGALEVTTEHATFQGAVMADGPTGWCPDCETWTPEHEWGFKPDFKYDFWLRTIAAANEQGAGFAGRADQVWTEDDREDCLETSAETEATG